MKKGLLIIPFLKGYGGTETVINNVLDQFDSNSYSKEIELTTFCIGGTEELGWLNHKNVHILNYPNNRIFRTIMYIFTLPFVISFLILKYKPDFVMSTNPIMWYFSKLSSLVLKKKIAIVAWYHYSFELKPVRRLFLKKADRFFVISSSAVKELTSRGIDSSKINIVYNPINKTEHVINNSSKNNIFVYVGRTEFEGQKNISELFYAFSKLKQYDWKLMIYGVGPDKEKLVQLSNKLNISSNIKWMGFQLNVFDEIKLADAIVLTSKFEGLPMVLIEGISNGLFAISSDCPTGPSEIINAENGLLYKVGNVDELAHDLSLVIEGKVNNNKDYIKKSVSKFYIDEYMNRIITYINEI